MEHLDILLYLDSLCIQNHLEYRLFLRTTIALSKFHTKLALVYLLFYLSVQSHLVTHYQKHDDTKNVECDHCSVKFKTEASRNKHVIYKHANPKPFKCDQCGRGFSTK